MTSTYLVSIFSVILSLCTSYIPGFRTWYAKLNSIRKKLLMLAGVVAISVVVFVLACIGFLSEFVNWTITCDIPGAVGLLKVVGIALIANQSTYLISPKLTSVKRVWNGN